MQLLSPLTRAKMAEASAMQANGLVPRTAPRRDVVRVSAYRCPDCSGLHEWEDEAVACCLPLIESKGPYEGPGPGTPDCPGVLCPICLGVHVDHHAAANCCLWKDLAPLARFRIASAVERGAEWSDAIAAEATP